jgi:hypothetical protein
MKVFNWLRLFLPFLLFLSVAIAIAQTPSAPAPTGTGALRGQVTDPSGAAITGATAALTPVTGSPLTAQTTNQGFYEFKSLPAGKYSLTVVAEGFVLYENDNVVIADQPLRLNVSMSIEVQTQKVQVSDTAPTVDVNPANNAGAITISGKELEALPDDPDELQSDLEALAGPSAGPNGGQMYIDGFTAGQLPPKSSIREIRINQNPFSSEYDKLGYGRIEIFTKPGTDKLHGQFLADGNDSVFNSPNPFVSDIPSYHSTLFNGSIGGPINKKSSFFFSFQRRDTADISAINAVDPTTGGAFLDALPNPEQRTNLAPRLDWAITKNNTLTVRYQYYRDTESNDLGVSSGGGGSGPSFSAAPANQLNLPTQAYNTKTTEDTLQVSDTQVFGTKVVNETRFQYLRDGSIQTPADTNPATNVLGSFIGGGSSAGNLNDQQNAYEIQNYTSVIWGNHTMKFGARLRATQDTNYSTSGFNGTFTFAPLPPNTPFVGSTATPTQLAITTGSPNAELTYFDAEPYFQDDWRVKPNITLSFGLRFEAQNAIHDHDDWAPRFGFAWGVGGRSGPPIVVIRGGSGIFYDRFQLGNILQAERLNGITQQAFVINNPTCYPGLDQPLTVPISDCGSPSTSESTTYQISPTLHAPYTLQSAISVERQVTKSATLTVNYLNSHGFDQFLTVNANAPFPGTPCLSSVFPPPGFPTPSLPACAPTTGSNLYRYISEANFKQNQLMAITNIRVGAKLQLFGYYVLNYANSDTSGVSSFPSNSYDISQDYGRAAFDVRQRLFLGGSIAFPYLVRLSPFMIVSSGSPFNITSPYDLNGDNQYNDRPGLVSTSTCPTVQNTTGSYIYCTPLGTFDASAATGRLLAPNYGTGPGHFVMNLRLTKTFGLGPRTKGATAGQGQGGGPGGGGRTGGGGGRGGPLFGGGGGGMSFSSTSDRRYNLSLGVSVRNVFNNVNVTNPNAVLGSPLFNVSNALLGGPYAPSSAANRRLDLVATFNF